MLRHTRCHIHKTRKPLDPKQSASHQALQRCLSEEDIPLDQLPNDRKKAK